KTGSTDFTFPVGNGTYLRPVAVESLSGASEFNVKYNATTPNSNQLLFPIQSMNTAEYWEISKISGGSAFVHLNWDNSKVGFKNYVLADIAAAWYNGSNWTDQGGTATGNATTTGDVTSGSVSSFGYFAIGSKSIPLPVNFLSITAKRKDNYTDLRWVTAEEINTDHYDVQRSDDGAVFTTLFSLPTTNRLTVQEYSYKDFGALNGIAYYRIRCVDIDGRSKLSKMVSVYDLSFLSNDIRVLNPAKDALVIRSRMDENQSSAFTLYNMAGKEILKGSIQLRVGTDNVIWLPFKPAHGIYILKLSGTTKESMHKILID
ncbi:MAG: T9SS type A sorting domain-containing protein, partial [Chitinophagaceae bacterium]